MSQNIFVTQGTLVADMSLIPYIRRQEIAFDAAGLRPYRTVSAFFDDVAINHLCQNGNKIEINSKKQITLNTAQSYTAVGTDIAWQGAAFTSASFKATVGQYNSTTKVLTVNDLNGNFDEDAKLYISNSTGSTLKITADVTKHITIDSARTFKQEEKVYCEQTNTFMTVIGTSGENLLYLNENFFYCNVAGVGTTVQNYHFKEGDMVYQTKFGAANFNNATFIGEVKLLRTAPSANTLTIEPIKGRLRVLGESGFSPILRNQSNTTSPTLTVVNVLKNNFVYGNTLKSLKTNKTLTVFSREHLSGRLANVDMNFNGFSDPAINGLTGSPRTILQLAANVRNDVVGKMIHITSGRGMGQSRRIVEASGNAIKLARGLEENATPGPRTSYSIGNMQVDQYGGLCGIFNLPEEPQFKFKTGERVFTLIDTFTVDDPNYTMKASAKFTSFGMLNINQRITSTPKNRPLPEFSINSPVAPSSPTQSSVSSNPQQIVLGSGTVDNNPRLGFVNGLSQTFFTPKPGPNIADRGIFVTSVDLFFKRKPNTARGEMLFPVTLRIARVENGYPTKDYLAQCTVPHHEVRVSGGLGKYPDVTDSDTITKFTFDDPVYLEPNSEYALTIGSESPEYELWVAELGREVLNSNPPRRISEQPYSGSLFKSQNSSTWTAYQNQDLMFVIHKANFSSSGGQTYFKIKKPPTTYLDISKLLLHVNDLEFTTAGLEYLIKSYRRNTTTGLPVAETGFLELEPHKMVRYGEITDRDATKTNTRYIVKGDRDSLILRADMASTDSSISPIINKESLSVAVHEYQIDNAPVHSGIINIVNKGVGYKREPNGNLVGSSDSTMNAAATAYRNEYYGGNVNVAMYNVTITAPTGSGAKGFAVANTTGTNQVDKIVITNYGSGYYESPTVVIADPIETANPEKAYAIAKGETGKSGGNIAAKYLTRQFTLLEGFEAGDLLVYMDVIRPAGTDIQVYYKVLGVDDPEDFNDKTWVRMQIVQDKTSKDENTIIEALYRPSLTENKLSYVLDGVQYPIGEVFKSFAVKVCLTSNDIAVVPYIQNIRISAVPAG